MSSQEIKCKQVLYMGKDAYMEKELPYRQIHLDFHTSPYIKGIGENFDSREFIKTL